MPSQLTVGREHLLREKARRAGAVMNKRPDGVYLVTDRHGRVVECALLEDLEKHIANLLEDRNRE